jgi:hypothetical protein
MENSKASETSVFDAFFSRISLLPLTEGKEICQVHKAINMMNPCIIPNIDKLMLPRSLLSFISRF